MEERLKLSLERIKEIPSELQVSPQFRRFFSSVSVFFQCSLSLYEREGHFRKKEMEGYISEVERSCEKYCFPREAGEENTLGDILSVLLYHSLGIVYETEEVSLCRTVELFISVYLPFLEESLPKRQVLQDILYSHFYDYSVSFFQEWKEKEVPFQLHNPLFPLYAPEGKPSPFFTEEYELAHRNDLALFFGSRFFSHIIQFFEKQEGRESLDPKKPGRSFFYPSSHAICLNAHQTKLLEELFHGNS